MTGPVVTCPVFNSTNGDSGKLFLEEVLANFKSICTRLKSYLKSKGIEEISNRDGRIFADFFTTQKVQLRKLSDERSNIQNEILGAIENYVASQLHSLKDGEKMPISIFLPAISAELGIIRHDMEKPFKGGIKCEQIQADNSIMSAVVIGTIMTNDKDAIHLASVLQHQFQCNRWTIFVTTDQKDILSKEIELKEMFLQCSRPEWALDYQRELTKEKTPIQHVQEIKTYTKKQKSLLDAVKNVVTV